MRGIHLKRGRSNGILATLSASVVIPCPCGAGSSKSKCTWSQFSATKWRETDWADAFTLPISNVTRATVKNNTKLEDVMRFQKENRKTGLMFHMRSDVLYIMFVDFCWHRCSFWWESRLLPKPWQLWHLRIGWENWKKLIPGSLHPGPFAEVAAIQRHELKTWEHTWWQWSHGWKAKDVESLEIFQYTLYIHIYIIERYYVMYIYIYMYCTKQTKGRIWNCLWLKWLCTWESQLLACSSRRAFLGDCADDDWQTCKLLWHPRKMSEGSEGNLPQPKHPVESHSQSQSLPATLWVGYWTCCIVLSFSSYSLVSNMGSCLTHQTK